MPSISGYHETTRMNVVFFSISRATHTDHTFGGEAGGEERLCAPRKNEFGSFFFIRQQREKHFHIFHSRLDFSVSDMRGKCIRRAYEAEVNTKLTEKKFQLRLLLVCTLRKHFLSWEIPFFLFSEQQTKRTLTKARERTYLTSRRGRTREQQQNCPVLLSWSDFH